MHMQRQNWWHIYNKLISLHASNKVDVLHESAVTSVESTIERASNRRLHERRIDDCTSVESTIERASNRRLQASNRRLYERRIDRCERRFDGYKRRIDAYERRIDD